MSELPTGLVTFLFSDVEGSTRLLERHGARAGAALARMHELFEIAVTAADGVIFETVGDAVYAAFARPMAAVEAAADIQRRLDEEQWGPIEPLHVRIGVHSGDVERRGRHYFGPALFRCARLMAIGHGGQTLVSSASANLVGQVLPDSLRLRDLGTHRLKDLGDPEHVYQLDASGLRDTFPPLTSLDSHPNNLPRQLTSFVGRDAEMAAIGAAIESSRLVTLTGPGGTGKTRLGLQTAADRVHRHAHGVFLVELAAISDPELVLPAIATTLGLQADSQVSPVNVLGEYLATRDVLILLDNCEHVLGAARDIASLLKNSSQLRILATSRAPLRIGGEREIRIPPLAVGDDDHGPAVVLFIDRATSVRPDLPTADARALESIRGICRQLDGMPLAIELAAARVRLLEPAEILARLDRRLALLRGGPADAPERHQSLEAAISWSVNLLTPTERALFAACSVFRGTWTATAAAAVSNLGESTLDVLSSLVDASLVTRIPSPAASRFTMFETLREYASAMSDAETAREARRRHAEHYRSVAERLEPQLFGAEGRAARDELTLELPNMETALRWAIDEAESDIAHGLVWALRWAWELAAGGTNLGVVLSEAVLSLPGGSVLDQARSLHATGNQHWYRSDVERARGLWETALQRYRDAGDDGGVSAVLSNLAEYETDLETQIAMYRESIAITRQKGTIAALTNTLHNLGLAYVIHGQLGTGRASIEEAVELAARAGDDLYLARGNLTLAEICIAHGESSAAAGFITDAGAAALSAGNPAFTTAALTTEALLIRMESPHRVDGLLRAAMETEVAEGLRPMQVASVARALSAVLALRDRPRDAALTVGISDSFFVPMGWRVNGPLLEPIIERALEPARRALGEDVFDQIRAAARSLPLETQAKEIDRLLEVPGTAQRPEAAHARA